MRRMLPIVALATSGCGPGPIEPETFSIALVEWHADLLDDLKVQLAYDEIALQGQVPPGQTLQFWDGSVSVGLAPGVVGVTGTGLYEHGDDVFRYVSWSSAVEVDGATVERRRIAGSYAWEVEEALFESTFLDHRIEGTLDVDGEAVGVDLEAQLTPSTVNRVEGTVADEPVLWENPEPDLP